MRAAGCAVVGVSTDAQATSDRFREQLCLPFALVGDPQGTIVRAYGVRIPVLGLAQRTTFLVGSDGRVRLAFRSQFDVGAHLQQVRAALGLT